MDLAGIDLPVLGSRVGQIRRNSTAMMKQIDSDEVTSSDRDDSALEAASTQEQTAQAREDKKRDRDIFEAIRTALEVGDKIEVHRLVQHYRSSRVPSPFATSDMVGADSLSKKFPLPSTYSQMTYNACLQGLVDVRVAGGSIALVLEVYNEMLERDLVPNTNTYQHVIKALCLREIDVWMAVKQWNQDKLWGRWMSQALGTGWDEEQSAEKDLVMEAYKAEGNFNSASKLFRAATLSADHPKYLRGVCRSILEAGSKHPEPDLDKMMEVFRYAQGSRASGVRRLYAYLFTSFGVAKDADGLKQLWEEYQESAKTGKGMDEREWWDADRDQQTYNISVEKRLLGYDRYNWSYAMHAFTAAGEPDLAMDLFEKMRGSPQVEPSETPDLTLPPHLTYHSAGDMLVALVEGGHLEKALEFYPRTQQIMRGLGFSVMHPLPVFRITDALILAGKWREAVDILADWISTSASCEDSRPRRRPDVIRLFRLYAAVLANALKIADTDPEGAADILANIPRFLPKPENFERENRLTINPSLFVAHCDLLLKLGRAADIAHVLDHFAVNVRDAHWYLVPLALRIVTTDISLGDLCKVWDSMTKHRVRVQEDMAEGLANLYFKERRKVDLAADLDLGSGAWSQILQATTEVTKSKINDGEYDELLVQIMDDLQELKSKHGSGWMSELCDEHAGIAAILVDRFGRERAVQMFAGALERRTGEATLPSTAAETPSEVSSGDASAILSIPPTPGSSATSAESASNSTGSFVPAVVRLELDRRLGFSVDAHTRRDAKAQNITPLMCLDILMKGIARGQSAHTPTLSRLIVNLARDSSAEVEARQVYMLAHKIIASSIPPEDQKIAWQHIEDGMLMACCHLGHLEEAGMHRARILDAGMAPSAEAYATMISCSKDTTDDALVARELFDESRSLGVKPNLFLYNTVISRLSKARKAEMALELFEHMRASGTRPSSVTYGAVLVSFTLNLGQLS